jgi:hypothetical protein
MALVLHRENKMLMDNTLGFDCMGILILPAKRKMNKAMSGTLAALVSGMKKQKPAARSVHAMLGNVNRRRFRRPNVSIV